MVFTTRVSAYSFQSYIYCLTFFSFMHFFQMLSIKPQVLICFRANPMLAWNHVAQGLLLESQNSVWCFQGHKWSFNLWCSSARHTVWVERLNSLSILPHEPQMTVHSTGSFLIHGSCTVRHINNQALQEHLCVISIQAFAWQPEAFSWRLLLDSHLFSHQLLAPLLCPGSNPIIRDAREGSAMGLGLSVNEQHRAVTPDSVC